MALDPAAFGEGSTDYTAYLACMAARAPIRAEYDAQREIWETLDNFLALGGQTATGPALLPGYGSVAEMQAARDRARANWEALYLELQRTEAECNKIAPVVKSAEQLAQETEIIMAQGGGIVPSDVNVVVPVSGSDLPPTIQAPGGGTSSLSAPTQTFTGGAPSTGGGGESGAPTSLRQNVAQTAAPGSQYATAEEPAAGTAAPAPAGQLFGVPRWLVWSVLALLVVALAWWLMRRRKG
jgi:hypothetical protein